MKKVDLIQLVGIYIILTALSYAFYIVLVAVCANDAVASALLSWTATMFATISLLYTFNSWREQKGSEVLSSLCKESYIKLNNLNKKIIDDYVYLLHFPLDNRKDKHLEDRTLWNTVDAVVHDIINIKYELELISEYNKTNELNNEIKNIKELVAKYQNVFFELAGNKEESKSKQFEISHKTLDEFNILFNKFRDNVNKELVKNIYHIDNKRV